MARHSGDTEIASQPRGSRRWFLKSAVGTAGAALIGAEAYREHLSSPAEKLPDIPIIPPEPPNTIARREYAGAYCRYEAALQETAAELTAFSEQFGYKDASSLSKGFDAVIVPPYGRHTDKGWKDVRAGKFLLTMRDDPKRQSELPKLNKLVQCCMEIEHLDKKYTALHLDGITPLDYEALSRQLINQFMDLNKGNFRKLRPVILIKPKEAREEIEKVAESFIKKLARTYGELAYPEIPAGPIIQASSTAAIKEDLEMELPLVGNITVHTVIKTGGYSELVKAHSRQSTGRH